MNIEHRGVNRPSREILNYKILFFPVSGIKRPVSGIWYPVSLSDLGWNKIILA
jgi:hypothetical protein